jgi:uncharacterized membrane protein
MSSPETSQKRRKLDNPTGHAVHNIANKSKTSGPVLSFSQLFMDLPSGFTQMLARNPECSIDEEEVTPMHYWFDGGHMIWMMISWILGVGLFVALFSLLFNAVNARSNAGDSPEAVLRRRYAAGEVDAADYARRLNDLRKTKGAA